MIYMLSQVSYRFHIRTLLGFMPVSLADEAVLMLFDSKLNVAAARAYLRFSHIDHGHGLVGSPLEKVQVMVFGRNTWEEEENEMAGEELDWTKYAAASPWSQSLEEKYAQ